MTVHIMTDAPHEVDFGGTTLKVGALKAKEFGLLMRWIGGHSKSPLERLEEDLKYAPEEDHRKLRYEAWVEQRDNWPYDPRSVRGRQVLFGETGGMEYFLGILLRKHNEVTDEQIDDYMGRLRQVDWWALQAIAFGEGDIDPEVAWATARKLMAGLDQQQAVAPSPENPPGPDSGATSAGPSSASPPT